MTDEFFMLHFMLSCTGTVGVILLFRWVLAKLQRTEKEAERRAHERQSAGERVIAAALAWYDDRKDSKDELRAAVRELRESRQAAHEKYTPRGSQIFIPTPRPLLTAESDAKSAAPDNSDLNKLLVEAGQNPDLESKRAEMQHALDTLHNALKPNGD